MLVQLSWQRGAIRPTSIMVWCERRRGVSWNIANVMPQHLLIFLEFLLPRTGWKIIVILQIWNVSRLGRFHSLFLRSYSSHSFNQLNNCIWLTVTVIPLCYFGPSQAHYTRKCMEWWSVVAQKEGERNECESTIILSNYSTFIVRYMKEYCEEYGRNKPMYIPRGNDTEKEIKILFPLLWVCVGGLVVSCWKAHFPAQIRFLKGERGRTIFPHLIVIFHRFAPCHFYCASRRRATKRGRGLFPCSSSS